MGKYEVELRGDVPAAGVGEVVEEVLLRQRRGHQDHAQLGPADQELPDVHEEEVRELVALVKLIQDDVCHLPAEQLLLGVVGCRCWMQLLELQEIPDNFRNSVYLEKINSNVSEQITNRKIRKSIEVFQNYLMFRRVFLRICVTLPISHPPPAPTRSTDLGEVRVADEPHHLR